MKQFIKYISTLVLLLAVNLQALAQSTQDLLSQPIPLNPKVVTGTLGNGLKYYIFKNQKPENRAELRLVVNAGSLQENDDQLGLAHFAEHMAFNGTKNFKKNELVDYLQSVGVKFGAHLNAYTSFGETVYMLSLPTDDKELLDKGFQILEDWSHNLLFDNEEIDKERGVVIEEWRLGQGADRRMLDKYLPVIYKNSKYAERLPIGTKDILENFKYETLKQFYKDWYRPDLMAVIAVGDFDVADIESKIKKLFNQLEPLESPRKREVFKVPDHKETYVSVVTDKEAAFTVATIFYKYDSDIIKSGTDYRKILMSNLFTGMLNQRLREIQQQADPPYIFASANNGSTWARTKSAFVASTVMKEDGIEKATKTILDELRKVQLYGFTQGEVKRQKLQILKSYENAYKEKDKSKSEEFAGEFINLFLKSEPAPGIEFEYNFANQYLNGISIEEINILANKFIKDENRVVVITGPEKEDIKMPDKATIISWLDESTSKELAPYEEEELNYNLVKSFPKAGKVIKQRKIDNIDVSVITLSNGVEIFLKSTDFKNDEIIMSAHSFGGHSQVSDKDYQSAKNAKEIIGASGIGDYSATDIRKVLAGKTVSVSPYIDELESGLSGSSTLKDMETMFQLIHLYFTSLRKDETGFQSYIARNKAILANVMSNPQFYFYDKSQRIMSQNHPRGGGIPTVADLEKVNLDVAFNFFKDQFSNPKNFKFWFVGNFKNETIIPLLEKYIGSISDKENTNSWKDLNIKPPKGMVNETVKKGTDPKSMVTMNFVNEFDYDRQEGYLIKSLADVLDIKLIEILREEKSGVYGVGASSSISKRPYANYSFNISFPCAPKNVNGLVDATIEIIKGIQKNGVSEENITKVKEAQRRTLEINMKENGFWLSALKAHYVNDWDYSGFDNYAKRIKNLTSDDLKRVANQYLNTDEYIKIVLYPED